MSVPKEEIVSKIRQGTQRRVEESQRIRQLQQERREELKEKASDIAATSSPSSYIPYILISLVFLSFPLSEPNVDWVLVSCFIFLNGTWTVFFRSSYWLNWAMLIFSNFSVVRLSPIFPEIPGMIKKLPPQNVAMYLIINILLCILLYYAYVERRVPWTSSTSHKSKKMKQKNGNNIENNESLEEFVKRRDRLNRLDLAASGVLMGNFLAMIALGIIPYDVLLRSFGQIVSFIV